MRLVPVADQIKLGRPARRLAADEAKRFDKGRPVVGRRDRRLDIRQCGGRISALPDTLQDLAAVAGPAPGSNCTTRNPATRSRGFSAQRRKDSTSLTCAASRNFRPAELHERNVAAGQFHLQRTGMVRGAEQDRLRLECEPVLAAFENFLDNVERLIGLIAHADQKRTLGGSSLRQQVLGEALRRQSDHCVGAARIGCVER